MLVFLKKSSRVTARNVDRLLITDSTFLTIPWPGFYVYNATKVSLKNNFFKAVAPRWAFLKKQLISYTTHLHISINLTFMYLFFLKTPSCTRPVSQHLEMNPSLEKHLMRCLQFYQFNSHFTKSIFMFSCLFRKMISNEWE